MTTPSKPALVVAGLRLTPSRLALLCDVRDHWVGRNPWGADFNAQTNRGVTGPMALLQAAGLVTLGPALGGAFAVRPWALSRAGQMVLEDSDGNED